MKIIHHTLKIDPRPDVAEDRRRLDEFVRSGHAVPLNEVRAWVESWGAEHELPRPSARKIGRIGKA